MELSKVQDEAQGSQKAGHLEAAAYSFDTFEEVKKFFNFRFSFDGPFRDKIECLVDFPLCNLNLSTFSSSKSSAFYDLFAVSNHYGGLHGGHCKEIS